MTLSKKKLVLILFVVLVAAVVLLAKSAKISLLSWGLYGPVNVESNVAIGGYDPVSYSQSNEAIKGQNSISLQWKDANWHFSSEQNKAQFQAAPEKFAPQFGGYCALGVSKGMTADIDPESWHLSNGKLYLFMGDAPRQDWIDKESQGIVQAAESQWAKFY